MSVSKSRKAKKEKAEKEPDLRDIYYFRQPNLLMGLAEKQISKIYAKGHYCYAISESANEVYAWGLGSNCVLGTRDEDNEFEPKQVHPK